MPCARATSRRCVAGLLPSCGLRPEQSRSNPPRPDGPHNAHHLPTPSFRRLLRGRTSRERSSRAEHATPAGHRRHRADMQRVGLTGGVKSGKSAVSRLLAPPQRRGSGHRPNGARTPGLAEAVAASASMSCGGTARRPRAADSPLSNAPSGRARGWCKSLRCSPRAAGVAPKRRARPRGGHGPAGPALAVPGAGKRPHRGGCRGRGAGSCAASW
jgi:hypothetical protein